MGVKSLANFNDRLRYSLGPLERVLYARFNNPIFDKAKLSGYYVEHVRFMIKEEIP